MKEEIIRIATAMKFNLDYDQWEEKGWLRFQLPEHLDEKDFRWIVWSHLPIHDNISRGASILFKAGQKQNIINSKTFTDL